MLCGGQTLIHSPIRDLLAEPLAMREERVRAPFPKPRKPHAEHVPVLFDDHLLSDRSLLVAPNHERQAVAVREKTVGDI